MAEPFESRLPAFDPRRTNGVLSGAVRAVYRNPATAAFADTLDHRRLPAGWEDDPHIQRLAADAWQAPDKYNSPFFRAWLGKSRLVDYDGNPLMFYHGSDAWGIRDFRPGQWEYSDGVYRPTGTWTSIDPKTSLSYLLRPAHPLYFDEMNNRIKRATAMGLMYGDDVWVPGLGQQDPVSLMEHYEVPFSSRDRYGETANRIWQDMAATDWEMQQNYLDKYYNSWDAIHKPVPHTALEHVVKMHPSFDMFYNNNREMLNTRDMDYDALASGRKIIGPFTTPDMGEIYPLYIKSERPLVVSPYESDPMFWYETGDMAIDQRSLSPSDRMNAWRLNLHNLNNEKTQFSGTPGMVSLIDDEISSLKRQNPSTYIPDASNPLLVSELYGKELFSPEYGKPTDNLVGLANASGQYDGVLTHNVYDGGGGIAPATDTFAFFDTSQAKSDRNLGTFSPNIRDILRTAGPAMLGGGALAAAMGRPTGASAAALPSGWVPPSAKAELEGMEPSGWMDPVNAIVDAATAGGGLAARALQAGAGMAQDWLGEQVPKIPEVPEEYYEAAQ